uniref:Fibronectin type-II domain-containing protein n=2 Tax=Sus scrofa TaxID=9823 RepID=A0A8W4FFK4_PIG
MEVPRLGVQSELQLPAYTTATATGDPSLYFNSSCVFPFEYGDQLHHNCIWVHSDYAWCSIDQKFQGRWRYCTARDPPRCIFPFLYRNKLFHRCTREGFVLSRSWCSLTENYDQDGKWKQCSPHQ